MKSILITSVLAVLSAVSVAQTVTHSGPFAAQLTRTVGGGDSGLDKDLAAHRLNVTPGNSVTLKYWARNGQATTSTINRVSMVFFTAAGVFISSPGDVNSQQGTTVPMAWTEYTSGPQIVPATAAKMNVAFRLDPNSVVVIDDVSVIDNTVGPTADIAVNGSFENWPGAVTDQPANWRFFAVAPATGELRRVTGVTAADPQWSSVK